MKTNPIWIIFDVGRVLFDFDKFVQNIAILIRTQEEMVFTQVALASEASYEGQITIEELWQTVLSSFHAEEVLEQVMQRWNDDASYWLFDIKKLIDELDRAGYKIAILTNNWGNQSETLRKNFPLGNIQHFFESAIEKLSKPDERFFRLVERSTGASGSDLFFIDDTKKYLESAEKLGWQTFQYTIGNDLGKTSNDLLRDILLT